MEFAGKDSVHAHSDDSKRGEPYFLGTVKKVEKDRYGLIEVRSGFSATDAVELISFKGENIAIQNSLKNSLGQPIERANPSSLVRIPYHPGMTQGQILRKVKSLCN